MSTEARSRELWFLAPRSVEVRACETPRLQPGQVLAKALASGVSRGTELLLFRGEGPTPFDPSLDRPGAPTYPRRYGYAWVGEVLTCGDGVTGLQPGSRVFALATHGDLHALDAASVHGLDSAIPASRAVLAANLETAITVVWDSGASLGDEVVVLGGGVVGLLVAWLATAAGARVSVVEPSARRRDVARRLGAISARTPEEDIARGDADVVVEATGDPSVLDRAVAHAAPEAVVVVASFYGARTSQVALGAEFHRRRLTLRASQVSRVPPSRAARWSLARRFDLVRRLLLDERLDALIDPPVSFDDAPRLYAELDASPAEGIQTVFHYR